MAQQHVDLAALASAALTLGNSTTAARIARFLDGSLDTSSGMYGHDQRMLRAVLDANARVNTVPVASLDEARRLAQEIAAPSHPRTLPKRPNQPYPPE